jgi:serine phosphatase RsbU (regulator of sigma subunit)/HAMP domain-containing protein
MGLRLTISRKIGLGFGLFILVVGVLFYLTSKTLNESQLINQRINDVYAPSVKNLEELDKNLVRSFQLMQTWAKLQTREDDRERTEALKLCTQEIPDLVKKVRAFSSHWNLQKNDTSIFQNINTLLNNYAEIRAVLPSFDSYADPINTMLADEYLLEGSTMLEAYRNTRERLQMLISEQRQTMSSETTKMNSSFDRLSQLLGTISLGIFFAGIIIAFLTSRSIVKPIISLRNKLSNLSQGIYSMHLTKTGNDEVGDMAQAVHKLITSFEKTKEFSLSVGAGNFDVPFTPLSEHDELGLALLRMKDDLASYRNDMEAKVLGQTVEIRRQKEEVESQKEKVTELYQDLQASIDYAQQLQETILPNDQFIHQMFPDSFVLFKPKATVSGDFYWFKDKGNKKLFAAADCTGHGVPGAFMSLVGHNVLNQATKVYSSPSQILNNANRLAGEVMRAENGEHYMKDGMDIAFCALDVESFELEFSGAHNPAYIIRKNELIEIKADNFSIGTYVNGEREFVNRKFQLEKGDCIYLFSDGYVDQFGGPHNKKFMRKNFRSTLLSICNLSMELQKIRLNEVLSNWQGDTEQIDDILVMGIRV